MSRLARIALLWACFLAPLPLAKAAIPWVTTSDGSGNLTNGIWTGDGTVQGNIDPADGQVNGSGGGSPGDNHNDLIVNDFTGGQFFVPVSAVGDGGQRPRLTSQDPGFWITIELNKGLGITGGTADLTFSNQNNFDDPGVETFEGFQLLDFDNVKSFELSVTYTEYLAGRNTSTSSLTTRPMLSAIGLVNAGTGFGLTDFDVGLGLQQIWSAPDPDGPFTPGLPSDAEARRSTSWDGVSPGDTSFTSTDGFPGNVVPGGITANNMFVRGFDYDNSGGANAAPSLDEWEQVYARTITFTVGSDTDGDNDTDGDDSFFASNTAFTWSLDGDIYENWFLVPEPSQPALLLLVSIFLLGRRLR